VWPLVYRLVIGPLVSGGARLVALFSPKVRRGLVGRRHQRSMPPQAGPSAAFAVHVHAASVGEFEQAKPIIEALRAEPRAYRITASFFSPSGYEQQGRYEAIDEAWYLPDDRPSEVRRFLDRIAPELIVIIRYDLWPEFLRLASERGVPSALVCATLRSDSARLRPVARGFFRWLYGQLRLIDCVGQEDLTAFTALGVDVPIEICGDTRYDRVVERADAGRRAQLPIDRAQLGDDLVVVAGSTWPADEALFAPLVDHEHVRLVIVPHEPTSSHVASLRVRLRSTVLLSELASGDAIPPGAALIVDRTGILLGLYALADVAYVGGAFGAGVHSVLEPAAYGIPVIAGPRIDRSRDAASLRDAGLLEVVEDAEALALALERFVDDPGARHARGRACAAFVRERSGATARILASLRAHRLLPGGAA
jgi:3-deoxy-D-manno-octulosonic-acid transferase